MKEQKMSLYLVIAENIRRKIAAGVLADGDKLPSCRDYAAELGVNPNTVQRAYTLLEDNGVVFTIAKKGVFVSSGKKMPDRSQLAIARISELKSAGFSRQEIINAVDMIFAQE